MQIIEGRPLIKMYKKSDCCKKEWVFLTEFHSIKDKYIPIKFESAQSKKYSKTWYGIRYIRKDDVLNY